MSRMRMCYRLYLDTCIANDMYVLLKAFAGERLQHRDVKRPLRKWIADYVALYYLLDLSDQWDLEFGSSRIMLQEIDKVRSISAYGKGKKSLLLETYDLLGRKVRFYNEANPPANLANKLARILHHRKDVDHVCQAILGKWDCFVTTDYKSILYHAPQLRGLDVVVLSPRGFIEEEFMGLEVLVRTLHGCWTTLNRVVDSWVSTICQSLS